MVGYLVVSQEDILDKQKVPRVPPEVETRKRCACPRRFHKAVGPVCALDRDCNVPSPLSNPTVIRHYLLREIKAWWSLYQGR